jgi:hypothetical protein
MIDPQTIPLLTLPFLPFAERKRLPRCAAIYFVLNAQGTVLYIGQSINLATRWAAHHRADILAERQATRIAWLVMEDVALLDAVEAACIAYFEPACNGYGPAPGGPRPYKCLLFRLPGAMLDDLKALAADERRSLNAQVLYIVETWVQRQRSSS